MSTTKIEFAVKMTCESCEKAVRSSLEGVEGIKKVEVNLGTGTVVVDTSLSTEDVRKRIESTGRKVVLKGLGNIAGVAVLDTGSSNVQGVVRFVQVKPDLCIIEGTVDGLKPNLKHLLAIHECGDTSDGCESVGGFYNPRGDAERVYGKIGTFTAEDNGRAKFRMEDNVIKLPEVIGRALVISEEYKESIFKRLVCGIIARSAGLFQNPKTICACDGVSLWDEQNTPTGRKTT